MIWYKKVLAENKKEIIASAIISIVITLAFSVAFTSLFSPSCWYIFDGVFSQLWDLFDNKQKINTSKNKQNGVIYKYNLI